MTDSLTKAIVRLFDQERFYAELVIQMDRHITKKVPTLGVCIKNNVQLYVNPDFFESLSLLEQVAVLKHECQHILNDHIPRSKDLAPEVYEQPVDGVDSFVNHQKHHLINIAADCSINPGIPFMLEGGMFPEKFDLEDGRLMEWYVEKLKDNKKAAEMTGVDQHAMWKDSEGCKDEIRAKIKKAVNIAAANARAAGKMSTDNELLIERLNYKARDWKGDLRRFASRALEVTLESSKKKRNRRYALMYPGVIKEERLHIGVAVDTSGSISDEALNQFMAEIANMAKYAIVTVVEADSEVKNSYLFDPKKKYKVSGRGGTAYQPAFDYFTNETDVDGVIYLGDMDNFGEALTKPKYPVLWAIIGNQPPPAPFGSKTKVEVKLK